jgi:hypothetical protein
MVDEVTLYEEITKISEDYFGPMAPRFVSRMVANHLHKAPERVTAKDLPELITWIRLAASSLTEETETIKEFVTRLNTLSKQPKRR